MPNEWDNGLCFALPPSLGHEPVRAVARYVADVLSEHGFTTVRPVTTYAQLEQLLRSGVAHAAWAPPAVCMRVARAGGRVAFRAIRYGAVTYRAAIVCRSERYIDLDRLRSPFAEPLRAAWVDRWSMGGYIMPRQFLRERGVRPDDALIQQMHGSYERCFDAVLEGDADITASYVSRRGFGYVELCGARAAELRVLGFTDEIPNDGIVVSSALPRDQQDALVEVLRGALREAERFPPALDLDGVDEPDDGAYDQLRRHNELAGDEGHFAAPVRSCVIR